MVDLGGQLFFLPEYNYPIDIKGVKFGTFLKDPNLLYFTDPDFIKFIYYLKNKFSLEQVYYLKQIHSSEIILVDNIDNFQTPPLADGMITKKKKHMLLAFHADCQIAFFFDKKQKIIGIAHAGFKGQVLQIYSKVIDKFINLYHSNVQDIQVLFSFSICKDHAEFINYEREFPKELWKYKTPNHFFDLKKMAKDELLDKGILEENIFVNPDCTVENQEIFYSYRLSKTMKRHISYIFLD